MIDGRTREQAITRARTRVRPSLAATLLALGVATGCQGDPPADSGQATGTDGGAQTDGDETVDGTATAATGSMADPDPPTWYQDIAPTVVAKCAGCHRDGGIAPYSFETYEDAEPFAEVIAYVTNTGTMPPFAADETSECDMNYGWKDDLRLSDEEIVALQAWSDAGAPEGDPTMAAEVPAPPSTELETVDEHFGMTNAVTIGGAQDRFLCFSLDPGLVEDRYLRGLQVIPGNDKIVHHVLIYVDTTGETAGLAGPEGYYECSGGSIQGDLIGAWAPGMVPAVTPDDVGFAVPAGSRLVMNIHYHPSTVSEETDSATGIDIDWLEERPTWLAQLALIGNGQGLLPGPNDDGGVEFVIPPGVTDHTEAMFYTLPADIPEVRLWEIGAHMHYLGVDMIIGTQRFSSPGPEEECLLHTPTYNFEWQRLYAYDAALDDVPRLRGGDKLYMRCTYDNTLGNPGVVEALEQQGLDEPVEVRLGEETLDEMCLGVYGIAVPNIF